MAVVQVQPDPAALEFHLKVGGPAFAKSRDLIRLTAIEATAIRAPRSRHGWRTRRACSTAALSPCMGCRVARALRTRLSAAILRPAGARQTCCLARGTG
jgi:hypothetical protein